MSLLRRISLKESFAVKAGLSPNSATLLPNSLTHRRLDSGFSNKGHTATGGRARCSLEHLVETLQDKIAPLAQEKPSFKALLKAPAHLAMQMQAPTTSVHEIFASIPNWEGVPRA
eukprot:6468702-Amphidinium_carterae.1